LRYGNGAEPKAGTVNDVIATLLSHRSVRGFCPTRCPRALWNTLIAAAQSASTSSNLQTWSVVAVTDPAKKAALSETRQPPETHRAVPAVPGLARRTSPQPASGEQEGVTLETMPHFETYLVAAIDASLAAQNATVAAESLGLSMVYIGALSQRPDRGRTFAGTAAWRDGRVRHVRGLPAADRHQRSETAAAAVGDLFHDKYDASGEQSARAAYDARMAAFSQRHEMTQDTWTKRVIGRMGNSPR